MASGRSTTPTSTRDNDSYRQLMRHATPASLFLSSVRLHFQLRSDDLGWMYFQDIYYRFSRKEITTIDFVHRNAVLLQHDIDLFRQLFPFLAPWNCQASQSETHLTVTVSHPQMNVTRLVISLQPGARGSAAYAASFGGSSAT